MLPLAYSDGAGAAGCTPAAKKRLLLFKVERLAVLAATASGTYSYAWCGDAIWTMLWLSWKPPDALTSYRFGAEPNTREAARSSAAASGPCKKSCSPLKHAFDIEAHDAGRAGGARPQRLARNCEGVSGWWLCIAAAP